MFPQNPQNLIYLCLLKLFIPFHKTYHNLNFTMNFIQNQKRKI
uniref:Uncharacterized protein n=1 Tax=Anguilla anguilla TaxID=7936 RepID=A0A0E9QF79_ANGAN